ncbi:MAG: lytic transglycosylase domain-containing protein [Mesorhizobium sp.]|uniref:lytic transglycosylase domain-containing protein n=1 Tax=Mesorhizobium sp. TaxID=1871066 RepID=UPI000FE57E7D|nr:lytic transglycosylase domain-containing protein [Mesorhizobium sp.]RWI54699.1 MAG: lytic transglycosylase domain-containing protein [Mesorhizobium sp.]
MAYLVSRLANRRLLLLLTTAALSWSWAYSSTCAAESRQTRGLRQDPAAFGSSAEDSAIKAIFDTRWADAAREYVLNADGRVRQTNVPTNSGFDAAQPEPFATTVRGINQSQFDLASLKVGSVGNGECAPSPLSAEDVARLVEQAAWRYGVDRDFALAIASVESRLDRSRNSPKGARGPMQLMPATAARLGVSDICDPADNIDGGVRLLRDLFAAYRNPLIVAAAYNVGEARVHEYGGVPPFPETVRFVAEVINRQLRLPRLRRETSGGGAPADADFAGKAPSLIGMNSMGKPRQWVGGVLQF